MKTTVMVRLMDKEELLKLRGLAISTIERPKAVTMEELDSYLDIGLAFYDELTPETVLSLIDELLLLKKDIPDTEYKVGKRKPVMSMFATEIECLRARDKWYQEQLDKQDDELAAVSRDYKTLTAAHVVTLNQFEQQAVLLNQCRDALESLSYWSQPHKKDKPELCGFEGKQGDESFEKASSALSAFVDGHEAAKMDYLPQIHALEDEIEALKQVLKAPEDYSLIPNELLEQLPEINTYNYNHDDVCKLNSWAIEVVLCSN